MSASATAPGTHMTPIKFRPVQSIAALMIVATFALAAGAVHAAPSGVSSADLSWAQGALARRGTLKILAADPATGLITVQAPQAKTSSASAGHVLLSGPGYRISATGSSSAKGPVEVASTRSTGGATLLQGVPVERRAHPIVCQGPRLLHIDSENLVFAGDAVRAEDGCEVHITNSRIVAKGFGVTARGASVHIDNSAISGDKGAISASDGAQVYARSSTFKGSIRRSGTAAFHNLGGNASD